jgi:ABC-2 type transport system permease protein
VDSLSLYLRYIALSMRAQMQYRGELVMQTLGRLLITLIEFVGIWALFSRFGSLQGGWSLAEVAFLYGLTDIIYSIAIAFTRGFDELGALVRRGDFDRVLLRPRSTVLQILGEEISLKRVGRLAQGVAVIVWASHTAHIAFTLPHVTLFLFAVVGGICLFFGIMVMQAASTFWTTETLEIWSSFTDGGAAVGQYPLSIFGKSLRRFFTFVIPIGCVVYFPAVVILDHPDATGAPAWLGAISPAAGFVFLGLSFVVWRLGLRRYASTGS